MWSNWPGKPQPYAEPMEPCTFSADLWIWEAKQPSTGWTFVTVPDEFTEEIRMLGGPARGFGSVRVEVQAGDQTWQTSVFPEKDRGFVLPIKAPVRRRLGLEAGDAIDLVLQVLET